MMTPIFKVFNGDVTQVETDILILKYAGHPFGADHAVATALNKEFLVENGKYQFFATEGKIRAKEVLVLGVPSLVNFEYSEIEEFGRSALKTIAQQRPQVASVASTLHGPGYGLDELAATDSLVRGLIAGSQSFTDRPLELILVERAASRADRLIKYLKIDQPVPRSVQTGMQRFDTEVAQSISDGGSYQKRLFAAIPFGDEYMDHWELALQPAAHENGFVIERLDHESFTGDIVAEIRNRITKCAAIVAILDAANPNVFLEVGYAWGVGKPAILLLSEKGEAPFDVKGHRIVRYGRLGALKSTLTAELKSLASRGVL
jgi:hypothetical protein